MSFVILTKIDSRITRHKSGCLRIDIYSQTLIVVCHSEWNEETAFAAMQQSIPYETDPSTSSGWQNDSRGPFETVFSTLI